MVRSCTIQLFYNFSALKYKLKQKVRPQNTANQSFISKNNYREIRLENTNSLIQYIIELNFQMI